MYWALLDWFAKLLSEASSRRVKMILLSMVRFCCLPSLVVMGMGDPRLGLPIPRMMAFALC